MAPRKLATIRFWEKVRILPNGCWEWLGGCDPTGYGRFHQTGQQGMSYVHRWAYETFCGPIPDGLDIDHTCHNADRSCPGGRSCPHRRCVNPDHLEIATRAENINRAANRVLVLLGSDDLPPAA